MYAILSTTYLSIHADLLNSWPPFHWPFLKLNMTDLDTCCFLGDLDISAHPDALVLLEGFNLKVECEAMHTVYHALNVCEFLFVDWTLPIFTHCGLAMFVPTQWFHMPADAQKFIGWTCSTKIKLINDVIPHICIWEAPNQHFHTDNAEILELFQHHVNCYIWGVGLPNNEYVHEIVSADHFESGRGNPLSCTKALLKTARATELLPVNGTWFIDVSAFLLFLPAGFSNLCKFVITHNWEDKVYLIKLQNGDIDWGPEQPINFQSCFSSASVINNAHMWMLLTVDEPTSSPVDTVFGRWLHL